MNIILVINLNYFSIQFFDICVLFLKNYSAGGFSPNGICCGGSAVVITYENSVIV
jgi:hypothetical protein